MGNALTCFERGQWDSHSHVNQQYKPAAEPPQDMTQPLSHYFISSGHNSYLEGNQLTSKAGVRSIQTSLRLGCRVIELDVYDGPDSEPVCTHGGTLTSNVKFRDCVRAIAKHGFHTSPYPVILTLENHAGKEQQAVMAAVLKQELANKLFVPEGPQQLARDGKWLSPEQLKQKVVIRSKVKPGSGAPELESLVYICNSKIASYDVTSGPSVPSSHSLPETKLPEVPEYARYGSDRPAAAAKQPAAAPAPSPAAAGGAANGKNSSAAAAAAAAGKADQVQKAAAVAKEEEVSAQQDDTLTSDDQNTATAAAAGAATAVTGGETAAAGVAASKAASNTLPASLKSAPLAKVFEYTSKHLLRCYPSGWRMIDNTNPDPTSAWAIGASLAALNWQLWDEAVWTNVAFFSRHNSSGYIVKPHWMTTDIPSTGLPANRSPRTLAITVYSAHKHQGRNIFIAKDDPYVELKVAGLPCDAGVVRTEYVSDSGRLVVDQKYMMNVTYPELAVLLVLLKDKNVGTADPIHGYAAIPLATLTPGAYKLPLWEPYVCREQPRNLDNMWVKLNLEWV